MRRRIPLQDLTREEQLTIALNGKCTAIEFEQICQRAGIHPLNQNVFNVAKMLFGDHPAGQKNIEGGSLCKCGDGDDTYFELYWSGNTDAIILKR